MNAKSGAHATEVLAEVSTSDRIDDLLREFDEILSRIRANRERTRVLMQDNEARLRRLERLQRAK
ncbi:MAG TPA: hypothetical protein PKE47_05570 [Verrucomicrobiota bacterium]|nr:hypothetical protein [Verrucomicrobiota bacterium]